MHTTNTGIGAIPLQGPADGIALPTRRAVLLIKPGIVLSLLIGTAAPSLAAGTPSYAQLLRESLVRAPALLEQAANVSAASAAARQARAWPNPSISAVYENLGLSSASGIARREDTYTLTQPFEIGGKRAARARAEDSKATAAVTRRRQAEIGLAAELAIAYASAEAAQRRAQLANEEVARAKDDLRAAQAFVKAGREAELRVAQARASVAAAQAAQQLAEADGAEALLRLSVLAGAKDPFTNIDHPFLAQAATVRPDVDHDLEAPPGVATAVAERDALAAQVRLEEKRWIPDLNVSAGWRKFGGTSESAKTVGVSLSLPIFDRNQGGIDAARARVSGAEARLTAARLEAQAHHRAAVARIAASDKRLEAAAQGESAAAEAYRMGRAGYDAGKTSLVELLATRRALVEAQTLTIEAQLAHVRAVAELSAAEGRIAFGDSK